MRRIGIESRRTTCEFSSANPRLVLAGKDIPWERKGAIPGLVLKTGVYTRYAQVSSPEGMRYCKWDVTLGAGKDRDPRPENQSAEDNIPNGNDRTDPVAPHQRKRAYKQSLRGYVDVQP